MKKIEVRIEDTETNSVVELKVSANQQSCDRFLRDFGRGVRAGVLAAPSMLEALFHMEHGHPAGPPAGPVPPPDPNAEFMREPPKRRRKKPESVKP